MAKTNGHAPAKGKPKHETKYILRRAKNGRRREKAVSMTFYGSERDDIQRLCRTVAQRHGYRTTSYAALLKWLAFQEWL